MILDKFKLEGRTALVTGSNRGIGQYYALALAEAGADIIGVSYESNFDETRSMIEKTGRKLKSYICDFSDRKDLYKFIKDVNSDFRTSRRLLGQGN
jgi:2-deoxy-D-gluconate 3-dehydrogenase